MLKDQIQGTTEPTAVFVLVLTLIFILLGVVSVLLALLLLDGHGRVNKTPSRVQIHIDQLQDLCLCPEFVAKVQEDNEGQGHVGGQEGLQTEGTERCITLAQQDDHTDHDGVDGSEWIQAGDKGQILEGSTLSLVGHPEPQMTKGNTQPGNETRGRGQRQQPVIGLPLADLRQGDNKGQAADEGGGQDAVDGDTVPVHVTKELWSVALL